MENLVRQSPVWQGKSVHYVPFGINQELFVPGNTTSAREALQIPLDNVVLFARIATHFKGLQILRKTFADLAPEHRYTILTVGEKGLLPKMPPNVTHKDLGWLNDDNVLRRLYLACDIFLMPSEQEAFGMMAIEAMSCGKTVLALAGTSLPEIINAPECGIAVSPEQYSQELRRLLSSPEELEKRSQKSLHYARMHYSLPRYVQGILEVYRQALGSFTATDETILILEQLLRHAKQKKPGMNPFQPFSFVCRVHDYYNRHGLRATGRRILRELVRSLRLS
jgi:glycosyltransferase involved in cell wall biosynthesis